MNEDPGASCLEGEDDSSIMKHRVCILGSNDVGKTALVNQFLTSEYMNTYDASLGMYIIFPLVGNGQELGNLQTLVTPSWLD